jgi:hypothetical protein
MLALSYIIAERFEICRYDPFTEMAQLLSTVLALYGIQLKMCAVDKANYCCVFRRCCRREDKGCMSLS